MMKNMLTEVQNLISWTSLSNISTGQSCSVCARARLKEQTLQASDSQIVAVSKEPTREQTSSHLPNPHDYRGSKVCRVLSHEFGVVRPHRTSLAASLQGKQGMQGVLH